jgi:hypothetical protein
MPSLFDILLAQIHAQKMSGSALILGRTRIAIGSPFGNPISRRSADSPVIFKISARQPHALALFNFCNHPETMFSTVKKHWVLVSASIAFIFFVVNPTLPFIKNIRTSLAPWRCHDKSIFQAPKLNVWADLSAEEAEDVVNFLFKKSGLNLTQSSLASECARPINPILNAKR